MKKMKSCHGWQNGIKQRRKYREEKEQKNEHTYL